MKHVNFIRGTHYERARNPPFAVHERELPYDCPPDNHHIYFIGDIHYGNIAMTERALKMAVQEARSKKSSIVISPGDLMETIDIRDKRYSLLNHDSRISAWDDQRLGLMELMAPIKNRLVMLVDGNHESRIRNFYRPMREMAREWGTLHANGNVAKFIFPEWRLLVAHKGQSHVINSMAGDDLQRATNELIALKRTLRGLPADDCEVVACGHYHKLLIHPPAHRTLLISDPGTSKLFHVKSQPGKVWLDQKKGHYRIHEADKWWMCCGSFLRGYMEDMPSYIEDAAMSPTELGYGHIEVRKGRPWAIETVTIPHDLH